MLIQFYAAAVSVELLLPALENRLNIKDRQNHDLRTRLPAQGR
jgi:hypothetical protein